MERWNHWNAANPAKSEAIEHLKHCNHGTPVFFLARSLRLYHRYAQSVAGDSYVVNNIPIEPGHSFYHSHFGAPRRLRRIGADNASIGSKDAYFGSGNAKQSEGGRGALPRVCELYRKEIGRPIKDGRQSHDRFDATPACKPAHGEKGGFLNGESLPDVFDQ